MASFPQACVCLSSLCSRRRGGGGCSREPRASSHLPPTEIRLTFKSAAKIGEWWCRQSQRSALEQWPSVVRAWIVTSAPWVVATEQQRWRQRQARVANKHESVRMRRAHVLRLCTRVREGTRRESRASALFALTPDGAVGSGKAVAIPITLRRSTARTIICFEAAVRPTKRENSRVTALGYVSSCCAQCNP